MDDDLNMAAVDSVRAFIARRLSYLDNNLVGVGCGFREALRKSDPGTHWKRALEMCSEYESHHQQSFPLAVHLLARGAVHLLLAVHCHRGSSQSSASVLDLERLCDEGGFAAMTIEAAQWHQAWNHCKALLSQADYMLADGRAEGEVGPPPYPARAAELRHRFDELLRLASILGRLP